MSICDATGIGPKFNSGGVPIELKKKLEFETTQYIEKAEGGLVFRFSVIMVATRLNALAAGKLLWNSFPSIISMADHLNIVARIERSLVAIGYVDG